ncbi:hypothetical protein J3F84DRAFT_360958 [Trichoderma pleuroticola]
MSDLTEQLKISERHMTAIVAACRRMEFEAWDTELAVSAKLLERALLWVKAICRLLYECAKFATKGLLLDRSTI